MAGPGGCEASTLTGSVCVSVWGCEMASSEQLACFCLEFTQGNSIVFFCHSLSVVSGLIFRGEEGVRLVCACEPLPATALYLGVCFLLIILGMCAQNSSY